VFLGRKSISNLFLTLFPPNNLTFTVHLPSKLTEKHHLMIFFSEIDVQSVRKNNSSSSSSETLVGVSIIPLLNSGVLVDSSGQGI
jgi:hypothetical protein